MVVILSGVSGAGKTSVGRLLASRLGWSFHDGDDLHPAANIEKMRSGQPLMDADRGPWLDAIRALIERVTAAGTSAVIACSALKQAYRERLTRGIPDVRLVYLRADYDTIRKRLAARRGHFMPADLLRSQFDALEEPSDALVVDVEAPAEELAATIARALVPPPEV